MPAECPGEAINSQRAFLPGKIAVQTGLTRANHVGDHVRLARFQNPSVVQIGGTAAGNQRRAGATGPPDAIAIDQIQHAPVGQVVDGKSSNLFDRGWIVEQAGQGAAGVGQKAERVGGVFAIGDLAERGQKGRLTFPSRFDDPHFGDALVAVGRRKVDLARAGTENRHVEPSLVTACRPMKHRLGGAVGVDDPARAEHDQCRIGAALDDFVKSHSAVIERVGKPRRHARICSVTAVLCHTVLSHSR